MNSCPTPPPPTIDNINKDIDAFARRLSLREYHTPENINEIADNPSYQPTILEKLNHREQKTYCRPSREPYLNTYIEKLRQEITDRTVHNRRFQRNNLSKRERLALDRLSTETHKGLKRVTLICLLCPMLVIIQFRKYHIWNEKKR